MVQWLIFQAPNAGGLGLMPGQGTTITKSLHAIAEDPICPHEDQRSCVPQLRLGAAPSTAK